ncbi:MAG: DUF2214 family protein [Flavobacteriales bacterium]|nr:DUF2214 family protein [Flavobacteriales bacterium]
MFTLRFLLAVLHLFALAIGLAAVYGRGRALRGLKDATGLGGVFHADNWYGVAAVTWILTGLLRAFGGLEKGTEYYLESHWFVGKLTLFGLVLVLELKPMITLIRWRMQLRKGLTPDLSSAPRLARLTFAQVPLLVLMVLMAAAMARGL